MNYTIDPHQPVNEKSPLSSVTIATAKADLDRERVVLTVTDTQQNTYVMASDGTIELDKKVMFYAWIFGAAGKNEYNALFGL